MYDKAPHDDYKTAGTKKRAVEGVEGGTPRVAPNPYLKMTPHDAPII